MCSSSVDKHNDTKLSKFSWRLTSLFSIASYPRSMYYDQGTRITLQSMVNELSFRWNCVEEFKGFNSLHGVLHCRCHQFNRGYAPMATQTSTSCQAAIFQHNFLWHILGQNRGNNTYKLGMGIVTQQGYIWNKIPLHWLCESGIVTNLISYQS